MDKASAKSDVNGPNKKGCFRRIVKNTKKIDKKMYRPNFFGNKLDFQ